MTDMTNQDTEHQEMLEHNDLGNGVYWLTSDYLIDGNLMPGIREEIEKTTKVAPMPLSLKKWLATRGPHQMMATIHGTYFSFEKQEDTDAFVADHKANFATKAPEIEEET